MELLFQLKQSYWTRFIVQLMSDERPSDWKNQLQDRCDDIHDFLGNAVDQRHRISGWHNYFVKLIDTAFQARLEAVVHPSCHDQRSSDTDQSYRNPLEVDVHTVTSSGGDTWRFGGNKIDLKYMCRKSARYENCYGQSYNGGIPQFKTDTSALRYQIEVAKNQYKKLEADAYTAWREKFQLLEKMCWKMHSGLPQFDDNSRKQLEALVSQVGDEDTIESASVQNLLSSLKMHAFMDGMNEYRFFGRCNGILSEAACRSHAETIGQTFSTFKSSYAPKGCYQYHSSNSNNLKVYYNGSGTRDCTFWRVCKCAY